MSRRDDVFNEWAAESLLDGEERQAWERSRDVDLGHAVGWVSKREMVESLAADRTAVESQCPTGYEWRRYQLEAVAEKAAVLQAIREDAA